MSIAFITRELKCGVGASPDHGMFNTRDTREGEIPQEHNLPQRNKLSQSHLLLQWSLQKEEMVLKDRINL